MFIELYRYKIHPGMQEAWETFMREEAIPRQTAAGMVILGHFWDRNDPESYWWMRRFESEEHREKLYKRVYEEPYWAEVLRPEIWRMAVKGGSETVQLIPTATSPIH